jgi:hypothetical protein
VEILHLEIQQDLWKGLWDTWKSQFMVLRKLGFIMNDYGWKIRIAQQHLVEVSHIEF